MKTAIIIGATSGLGREVVKGLLQRGWRVGVTGRRFEALEALQKEFGAESVSIRRMDITSEDATVALDSLIEEIGMPDLFLHVSGIGYQNPQLDLEKELAMVRTNCEGMVRMVVHFMNRLTEAVYGVPGSSQAGGTNGTPSSRRLSYGKGRRAHIAVVTSVAGTGSLGIAPAYSATKKMQSTYISALAQLSRMKGLPLDFTDIKPGFVRTEILNPDYHYPMIMEPCKAADLIIRALEKRKRIFIFDWKFRAIVALWKLIPRCIWERLTIVKTN